MRNLFLVTLGGIAFATTLFATAPSATAEGFNNCLRRLSCYSRYGVDYANCYNYCQRQARRPNQQCEVLCGGGRCVRNCFH
jgi:hypothetical protein